MKRTYCDRCGKEFDAWNQGKFKYDIGIVPESVGFRQSSDICDDCRVKLNNLLDSFFNNINDDNEIVQFDRLLSDEEIEAERQKVRETQSCEDTISIECKGKWKEYCYQNYICSNCNYIVADTDIDEYKYCPNCGVKMVVE
jgi:rubrerythrin